MTKNRSISIERAKALADRWEAQYDEHIRTSALASRFKDATPAELIRMYESGSDDRGGQLSQGEFAALVERWLEVFGAYPPSEHDGAPDKRIDTDGPRLDAPGLQDDTTLSPREVERLTGVSARNIRRMFNAGRFPKPMHLSPRRIGWPAGEVKEWLSRLDDQRRATRQ